MDYTVLSSVGNLTKDDLVMVGIDLSSAFSDSLEPYFDTRVSNSCSGDVEIFGH